MPESDSISPQDGPAAPPERSTTGADAALPLIASAAVLFLLFGVRVLVLGGIVPPALLNPSWQLRLASQLVTWGFLPLLGLGLLQVSITFADIVKRPQRRLLEFYSKTRQIAVLVTFGFLLLLPLQAGAAWKLIHSDFRGLEGRTAPQARLDAMEKAIREAPDAKAIQNSLTILRGPAIAPQDLQQPLPQLKQLLLQSLAKARASLTGVSRQERTLRVWTLLQECLGNSLAALAYAFGFAAFAQSPKQDRSLLQSLLGRFNPSDSEQSLQSIFKQKRAQAERDKRHQRDLERHARDQLKRQRQEHERIERERRKSEHRERKYRERR